ncbi:type IV pilus modification protein PilV [Stenotrophomonas sp. CFBP8980]|uniref:type IV pilus modification PilV family protein n=1 Tax=Stenotrophomonas sp. CFBP8980 TaxID=3096523 RepID=UPI002A6B6982|nr:type IV pilus modification protein PilV [Stenotrophomonas sp. CFBP8980]MDY1035180.1 type IV pilus modification protein PilV [Stenotrophomonas sp. CFBP8980]
MIEVMVAVLLLSIGGLAAASAQLVALKRNEGALVRTAAVYATSSLAEAIRANPAGFKSGAYDTNGTVCTHDEAPTGDLARQDITHWLQGLSGQGDASMQVCGAVRCTADACTASITWDDQRAGAGTDPDAVEIELGFTP